MKNTLKLLCVIALVEIIEFLVVACGGSDDGNNNNNSSQTNKKTSLNQHNFLNILGKMPSSFWNGFFNTNQRRKGVEK